MKLDDARIATVGLGYVGLPLAVAFSRRFDTVGFDIKPSRIKALREGVDHTREVGREELLAAERLRFTHEAADIAACNVYVITVPTPIDAYRRPDLEPLLTASRTVGRVLSPGDVVIYESTVYPGATEDDCVPVLEAESGMRFNRDFFCGYSPERINPGDREHRVADIVKVTAGSTPQAADFVDALYASVITAGTHRAESIRVAEAAKVIENTQRDVNIALVNELAILFNRLGIDTEAVLQAAGSKWNFLPFRPGLVGGHCIGVDPYYLTHKAQAVGHHPEMILAGRRINDGMGHYVAAEVIKLLATRNLPIGAGRILVLGLTFKENCPDLRNTRVVDTIRELQSYGAQVDIHDPWVDPAEARETLGLDPLPTLPEDGTHDAGILAVAHREFREMGAERIRRCLKPRGVLYDIKHIYPRDRVEGRL